MPAHERIARASRVSTNFALPALLLLVLLVDPSPVFAAIKVNLSRASESIDAAVSAAPVTSFGVDGIAPATASDTVPRWNPAGDAPRPTAGKILKEVAKQTIDQPGHFLIGAAPVWASRYLIGVPWYGWVLTPLLAYREWLQWPSKRWWDPPLDWAFLTLGTVVATCRRRSKRTSLNGFATAVATHRSGTRRP
jgi:hypothetical protein